MEQINERSAELIALGVDVIALGVNRAEIKEVLMSVYKAGMCDGQDCGLASMKAAMEPIFKALES